MAPEGEALADAIRALSHPRRRELLDSLSVKGPGSVGQLARRTGMAVGSVSHHARVLANAGFIEPAPDLAGDTRESWWRALPRTVAWGPSSFRPGSAGEELAALAGQANFEYLVSAARAWQSTRSADAWNGVVTDTVVAASERELDDLGRQVATLLSEWTERVRASAGDGQPRRQVRAIAMVFPEARHG